MLPHRKLRMEVTSTYFNDPVSRITLSCTTSAMNEPVYLLCLDEEKIFHIFKADRQPHGPAPTL
jgi:hypothetical protein